MDCNFFFGMFHQGGETGPKGSNVAGNRAKREFRGVVQIGWGEGAFRSGQSPHIGREAR